MKFFALCTKNINTGLGVAKIFISILCVSSSANNNLNGEDNRSESSNLSEITKEAQTSIDENPVTICTHDGTFHCDEVFSCYLLKILHPNAKIIRSRDPYDLENSDYVLDVGNVYDPKHNRFDHHQKNFNETISSLSTAGDIKSSIKVSSAGLIYHHFGRSILEKVTGETDQEALDYLYKQMYYNLVQEIDGMDNGIPPYPTKPIYNICSHLNARVSRLNKSWRSSENWNETEQFYKAMSIVAEEFREKVKQIFEQRYPAKEILRQAIKDRHKFHHSGEIIRLQCHCPWKSHIFDIEKTEKIEPPIKYVVFKSDNNIRVQCVPSIEESYGCRILFPESWRGLRGGALSKEVGINGCIFVHTSGFIGGHDTIEGATQMALRSIRHHQRNQSMTYD